MVFGLHLWDAMNVQLDPAQQAATPGPVVHPESGGSFGSVLSKVLKSDTGEKSDSGKVAQPTNTTSEQNGAAQAVASKLQTESSSQSTKSSGTKSKTDSREKSDATPAPSTESNASALIVNPLTISPILLNNDAPKPADGSATGDKPDSTAASAIGLPQAPAAAPATNANPGTDSKSSVDTTGSAAGNVGQAFARALGPEGDPAQPASGPGAVPVQPASGPGGDPAQPASGPGAVPVQPASAGSDGNSKASAGEIKGDTTSGVNAQNQKSAAVSQHLCSVPPLPALQQTQVQPLPEAAPSAGTGAAALPSNLSTLPIQSALAVAQGGSAGESSLRKTSFSALSKEMSAGPITTAQSVTQPGAQKSVTAQPNSFAPSDKVDGRKNNVDNKTNTSGQHQDGGQQSNADHASAGMATAQDAPKVVDHGAAQISLAVSPQDPSSQANPLPAKGGSVAQSQTPDTLSASATADAQPSPLTRATDMVQTARLVHGVSESELRIGVQVGEFGRVDIHTIVTQTQVAARIYVEHHDLANALATNLAPLHEKFAADHRVNASVELLQTGTQGFESNERQQQQARAPGKNTVLPASDDAVEASVTNSDLMSVTSDARLNMHA